MYLGKTARVIAGLGLVMAISEGAVAQTNPQRDATPTPSVALPEQPVPSPADDVVVVGEAYATEKAIDAKRQRGIVSDSISASEVGAIPEFGLGEALQRIPGVSFQINNGRGEAEFESIRGLNADYNSVTLDGILLPSTEETRRQVSFDVLPSIIANQLSVYKTYTADLPSDAIGGVTNLTSHSAFDHDGTFVAGHADFAYWDREPRFHGYVPSGQGDLRASTTFGPDHHFGALLLASYYNRESNSLNSYSLPYSYYGYSGSGSQTVTATPLTPTTSVAGLTPVPDRRRWYFYDNRRQRPGVYGKLEFDDRERFHASLSGGFFQHTNDEYRYSAYLNRGAAAATFTGPTQATFATGSADDDFDHYYQKRQIWFGQATGGYRFDERTKIDATFNYAHASYRQDTTEDVFLTATSANFAPTYVGSVGGVPLFQPANPAAFANPANYNESYHLNAVDRSKTREPQFRIDLVHTPAGDSGLGFQAGFNHRRIDQFYTYDEYRLNPIGTVTLAQTGATNGPYVPPDSAGLALNFLNPTAVDGFVAANPALYAPASTNLARSTLNDFSLAETVDGGYAQASYRAGRLYAQAGLRYESNTDAIRNYQPFPINSTTNFIAVDSRSSFQRALPEANVSFDATDTVKLRGAASQTIARPRFSDLAQNSALTLSGTTATETISNPNLRPRTSTNYDLSAEWYPRRGSQLSLALFEKDVHDEIFTLTTTQQNVSIPGLAGNNYTLITSNAQNVGNSRIRGLELSFNQARFDFLPGAFANLGLIANVTLIDFDAPTIQMADGVTFRKLPQPIESSGVIGNVAVFYRIGRFSGEMAYNHTGKQPLSFDRTNVVNDQYYRATNTIDAQVSYRVLRGVDVRLQVKNITDETNQKVVGPSQGLNYSLLDNGRAYYAGIGFAF